MRMHGAGENWADVMERLLEGDEAAFHKLARLIAGFLGRLRAFDFRDEWEDLIQEVLTSAVRAIHEERIRNPQAILGYLRSTTHNLFCDRLRRHVRWKEDQNLPWEEIRSEPGAMTRGAEAELGPAMRRLLGKLPNPQGEIVFGVYGCGRTYEQVARDVGVPLGTLKRHLRDGLARLREEMSA